jgi:hypothetical protein
VGEYTASALSFAKYRFSRRLLDEAEEGRDFFGGIGSADINKGAGKGVRVSGGDRAEKSGDYIVKRDAHAAQNEHQ